MQTKRKTVAIIQTVDGFGINYRFSCLIKTPDINKKKREFFCNH